VSAYITGLNEFDYLWSCMLTPVSLETQLSHLATKIYKLKFTVVTKYLHA